MVSPAAGAQRPLAEHPSQRASHTNLTHMERSLLEDGRLEVRAACFGLAGTVIEGNVKLTNLNWEVDETSLALAFGIKRTWRLNDMAAIANEIPHLTQADLRKSTTAVRFAIGPLALLAPGNSAWGSFPGTGIRGRARRVCPRQTTDSSSRGLWRRLIPGGLLWYETATRVLGVGPRLRDR